MVPPASEDAFGSGRISRASETSARTRLQDLRGPSNTSDLLGTAAPGVMSMLRTTTDIGDVGSLALLQNRGAHSHRQPQRRRLHPSRTSDGSLRSTITSRVPQRKSNIAEIDGSSIGQHNSISSLHTTKTMLTHYGEGMGPPPHPAPMRGLPANPPPGQASHDGRSYSLTQSYGQPPLTMRRSASSLRSQASNARGQRPRPPYPPLSRHPGPGYRSASPTISDYNPSHPPMVAPFPSRPPSRHPPGDYGYRRPIPPEMRPRYPPPALSQYPPRHMLPHMHGGYDQGHPPYQLPPRMQGPPRQPGMYPLPLRHGPGHQQRGLAYAYEVSPSSSGPSSSGPHSSNPSTPQDSHQLKVVIAPEYVPQWHDELPDENGEQAIFSNYIAYAAKDGLDFDAGTPPFELEAEIEEPIRRPGIPGSYPDDVDAPLPDDDDAPPPASNPHTGSSGITQPPTQTFTQPAGSLVQRIKFLLENKADESPALVLNSRHRKDPRSAFEPRPETGRDTHDATDGTVPRALATDGPRDQAKITRDMVRAMTCPSPTKLETIHSEGCESTRPFVAEVVRSSSEYPSELGDYADPMVYDQADPHELSQMERSPTPRSLADDQSDAPSLVRDEMVERPVSPQSVAAHGEVMAVDIDVSCIEDDLPANGDQPVDDHLDEVVEEPVEDEEDDIAPPDEPDATASDLDRSSTVVPRVILRGSVIDADSDETADSNAGVTSDIVTDIAVRFSIPCQSSGSKASIVRVLSPTGESQRVPQLHEDIFELPSTTTSPRNSVYITDSFLPLQLKEQKKLDSTDDGTDLSSFIRRSYPRRQSALFGDKSSHTNATDDTHATVLPTTAGRLPGVKEESGEDLPGVRVKSAIVKSVSKAALHGKARTHLSLSEIRDLPSLNFSQVNLLDQLNAAFDGRPSLEILHKRASTAVTAPSPLRSASIEALRGRQTSFSGRPDSFQISPPAENSESFSVETLMASRKDEQQRRFMLSRDQEKISTASKNGRGRSLSPSELLGLASDADRLSIPSVSGLSERISELLPSLKRLHLDSVVVDEDAVGNTIDEIHRLGRRPVTMLSNRSSGVLRSLAALADDIATNGTHTSTVGPGPLRLNKSLPPLPQNIDDTDTSLMTTFSPDSEKRHVRRTQSEHRGSTPGLFSSSTTGHTRRSLTVSSPNSRPWNFDENYPWSADTGLLSIEFPLGPKDRDSITSHMLREAVLTPRKNDRTMLTATIPSTGSGPKASDASGSYPGDLDPTATVTADTLTQHTRKFSKKAASLLGSLSRRAKLPSPARSRRSTDTSRPGTASRAATSARPVPAVTILTPGSLRPHAVGDRYPSCALQAPVGYEIDETRSYFSDEPNSRSSSVRRRQRRGSSLRKRLSRFKNPDIRVRPATEELGDEHTATTAGFTAAAANPDGDTPTDTTIVWRGDSAPPTGMGRVEFTIKRLGERFRMVWNKGAILLRRVSGRARRDVLRREAWLDQSRSVYSGA